MNINLGATVAEAVSNNTAALYPRLKTVYRQIRQMAPKARILPLLYPNPMQPPNSNLLGCAGMGGPLVSSDDTAFIYNAVRELNNVISNAAKNSGVITSGDVVDLNTDAGTDFPFHNICQTTQPLWFVRPVDVIGGDFQQSMHPNKDGDAEIARIILAKLSGGAPLLNQFGMSQGQTQSTTTTVGANQGSAVFSSTWPGSDIVMTLVSPSGRVINRSTVDPLVDHTAGATYEVYNIFLPEAGAWTVKFYGADVAPQGEPVSYQFSTTPRAPGDADGDGIATCSDLAIVKASFGKRAGQPGFDPRADLNGDGVVDIRDLSAVAQQLLSGTVCQ